MRPISPSTQSRITTILLVTALFTVLVDVQALVAQRSLLFGAFDGALIGCGVGLFEEFYVQSRHGRWLRSMHPLQSMLCYTAVVLWLSIAAIHVTHLLFWQLDDLPRIYHRLPVLIPLFLVVSLIGVGVIRVMHFIGVRTLFHLLAGTYYEPKSEAKVLVFLDMNGSTALSARLGAFPTGRLVAKFIFDVSKPVTDNGGDIYLYKGDGLVAVWDWQSAVRGNAVLRAVDCAFAAIERERAVYRAQFGTVPSFRVGIHGGEVVVSEQGDARRGIGIYGEVINIASRMEEAARTHRIGCVVSGEMAAAFDPVLDGFEPLPDEYVKGLPEPIRICEYRPRGVVAGPLSSASAPRRAAGA